MSDGQELRVAIHEAGHMCMRLHVGDQGVIIAGLVPVELQNIVGAEGYCGRSKPWDWTETKAESLKRLQAERKTSFWAESIRPFLEGRIMVLVAGGAAESVFFEVRQLDTPDRREAEIVASWLTLKEGFEVSAPRTVCGAMVHAAYLRARWIFSHPARREALRAIAGEILKAGSTDSATAQKIWEERISAFTSLPEAERWPSSEYEVEAAP